MKLSILGGSALATPLLFETIGKMSAKAEYSVVLFGQDKEKLELVHRFSEAVIRGYPKLNISLETTTSAEKAIEGSDIILNQIRVGGLKGRIFDERFPREFGIPGEETVGPGGFSNSVRGIPVILEYCKLIEKLAPESMLLNLSNPSSIIQYAIQKYTKVNVLGTCDTPISTIKMVADSLSFPIDKLTFDWFGMHHFGWITGVRNGKEELLDQVLKNLDRIPGLSVDPEVVEAIKAIPASYLKYYFHPDRILAATEGRTLRAEELLTLFDDMQKEMAGWKGDDPLAILSKRGAVWYDKIVVPALMTISEKSPSELILSIKNGQSVAWLPEEAIIELPVSFLDGKVTGIRLPKHIPQDISAMIARNCAYEMLAAEAIVENDREKAIRALLSNLLVTNFNQVKGIMQKVWKDEPVHSFQTIKFSTDTQLLNQKKTVGFQVPKLYYGSDLLEKLELSEERVAVITMEVPWKQAEKRIMKLPDIALFVDELDWYRLETMERSLPEIDAVIGLGGGMAIDAAKFVAWKRHIPMDAVQTITSVDACVTKSIAARIRGHVTYIGYLVPRNVYVDYQIIQTAPLRLNRSGVGDILCAHAALFDWKLAKDFKDEKYDPSAVTAMTTWFDRIEKQSSDVATVNEAGIRLIMEAFEDINLICRKFGSSRPQEGSDHTFAYNAEYQTGRSFLHGELVALGAFVMASLQNNNPEKLSKIYQKTGILWQPKDIGLTKAEFSNVLQTLNWYQKNFGRRFTVLDTVKIEKDFIENMINQLSF
jgi:6-phospho-beta-glucosidase